MSAIVFADTEIVERVVKEACDSGLKVQIDIVNEPGNVAVCGDPADVEHLAGMFTVLGHRVNLMESSAASPSTSAPAVAILFAVLAIGVAVFNFAQFDLWDTLGWYGAVLVWGAWLGAVTIGFGKLFFYYVRSGFRLEALPYSGDRRPPAATL